MEYPVVTILGPRQSGKTTLVRMNFPKKPYFSLEDPDIRAAALQDPRGLLAQSPEGAILDEIQRAPELLSYIQGLVDRSPRQCQFILTGSHQPALHQAISQSLAGRTALLTLLPFSLNELRHYRGSWDPFELAILGAFPRVHQEKLKPDRFYNGYLQTYVERDVRAMVNVKDLRRFQQFLVLLAGRVGQVVNYMSLSNDLGVSSTTIKHWMIVLAASFVVFELPPYFANLTKRVIKSPKVYFTDTGLAAHLVGIHTKDQALRDPLRGFLYENLIVTEILKIRLNHGLRPGIFFYRDTHGNEVDLLVQEDRILTPIEIKSAATFTGDFSTGIHRFQAALKTPCRSGVILYNGKQPLQFHGIRVLNPLSESGLAHLTAIAKGEES